MSALVFAVAGWALAPIFIRYLSISYDSYTQNVLRYASAAVPLTIICLLYFRRELWVALGNMKGIMGISILNVVQQQTWTVGCAGATATTAQLISKLSVVLVVIFSFYLFHEERAVIKSPIYLAGTLLSLAGVCAVMSDDPATMMPVLNAPTLLLLATAVFWGGYMVWAKHIVMRMHPIPMFTAISIYVTLGFVLLDVFLGRPASLVRAGGQAALIGIVSGLIPIAMAHPCYHFAQKHLGAAWCSSISLLNPLMTYAVALFFFADERMVPTQWAGAAVLLAGTLIVTYAGRRVATGVRMNNAEV
jgi:drug/metabolite transporter (DMT)-like permease